MQIYNNLHIKYKFNVINAFTPTDFKYNQRMAFGETKRICLTKTLLVPLTSQLDKQQIHSTLLNWSVLLNGRIFNQDFETQKLKLAPAKI